MNGISAEKRGHQGKEYWKSRLHPQGEEPGKYTKRLTHKKERKTIKQIIHNLKQEIDSLFGRHLHYQLSNNEEIWTKNMDSC